MIVGTAGHIDHGKTTLVRALTGVDTDRLKEEKARGISIELGYAYTPLANGDVLGFVDVPGHERLVHTMVAGASGIDFALLVVAADDGVMPQTREHLAILDLLGVSRGAVALTKIDRVDAGRVDDGARRDQCAARADARCAGAPIFAVDARDAASAGIVALRDALCSRGDDTQPTRAAGPVPPRGRSRLHAPGHGTIVTGTVVSGTRARRRHDRDHAARPLRARAQHPRAEPSSRSGARGRQRCALNLAGVETSDTASRRLARRCARARDRRRASMSRSGRHPIAGSPMRRKCTSISARPVRQRASIGSRESAAGRRAQLVLDAPICAAPGDRFIVRDAQAAATIGGGTVLDPYAPARQRRSEERMRYLDATERLLAGDGGVSLIAEAPYGLRSSTLIRLANDAAIVDALPDGTIVLESAGGPIAIAAARLRALRERIVAAMADFHATSPDEPGLGHARLHRIAAPGAPPDVWTAILKGLIDDGTLVRNGAFLRLPEHRVHLSERELQLAADLLPRIAAGGFDPPWVRDLASAMAATEDEVRKTLRKLNAEGSVQQVVRDLFYAPERVRELASIARRIAGEHGTIEAAVFRDAIGLGRKRTIQILEFFDRVGYTRRVRDAHRLREGVSF